MADENGGGSRRSGDPVVDPTRLTTEALNREIASVREVIEQQIDAIREVQHERSLRIAQQFESVENQRKEQKQDCVEASTPVLCSDLIWRPAGELEVGQELITCDETANYEIGKRTPFGYRRGVVVANSIQEDDLVSVKTPVGELVCNPHHPFLARDAKRRWKWQWVEAQHLNDGNIVMHALDVWAVEDTWEAGWLAGIMDGEGCLHLGRLCRISVTQRESATADRIGAALARRVVLSHVSTLPGVPHRSPKCVFQVDRRAEVMKLLGSIRPPRLMERADETWEGKSIAGKFRGASVISVEPVGRGPIAMLTTSTGTYIAGGFAVHNTQKAVDAALAAQKEAVKEQTLSFEKATEKSERSINDLLTQLRDTVTKDIDLLRGQVSEVKDSVTALQNQKLGAKEDRTGLYAAVAGFAGLFGIVSLVVAFVAK